MKDRSFVSRVKRTLSILSVVVVIALLGAGYFYRRPLMMRAYSAFSAEPQLQEAAPEEHNVRLFDDYFTVEELAPGVWAIGEPRYPQQNYNYLIAGTRRAILFDSGPGWRDIRPVVGSLTPLPVTAIPSHLHYDHIGNHSRFENVGLIDLQHLRRRAVDNTLTPTADEYLGFMEGLLPPALQITEWLQPNSEIDLGGRRLEVLLTPGHTPESISLLDRDHGLLFSGDYLYEGELFAFLPGGSLADYLTTSHELLARVPPGTTIYSAHRVSPPGAPALDYRDLEDLQTTLDKIRSGAAIGEGRWLKTWRINDSLSITGENPIFLDWD